MEHSVKAFSMTAENEHYIFKLSDKVEREHVNYYTRYGIEIAADLYYAKDIKSLTKIWSNYMEFGYISTWILCAGAI